MRATLIVNMVVSSLFKQYGCFVFMEGRWRIVRQEVEAVVFLGWEKCTMAGARMA